jgi:hypothetical protein
LSRRFPVVSQGGAVVSSYVCCYLIYGRIHGVQIFRPATVVGGMTVVLLALVRRLIDDIDDVHDDTCTDVVLKPREVGIYRRRLVLFAIAIASSIGIVNAACNFGLGAISIGTTMSFAMAVLIARRAQTCRIVKFAAAETCTVLMLVYSYAVWRSVTGAALPVDAVIATVGLFWTAYQFWGLTRKVGATEGWPAWDMTPMGTRRALTILLSGTAIFGVRVAQDAQLSIGYYIYSLALPTVFLVMMLLLWPQTTDRQARNIRALWAGLPLAVAVEIGLLIAVFTASI